MNCAACGKEITREMAARREAVSFHGKPHCVPCVPAQGVPEQTLRIVEEGVGAAPPAPVRTRDTVAAAALVVEEPSAPRPSPAPARSARTPGPAANPPGGARAAPRPPTWDGAERRRVPRTSAKDTGGARKKTTTTSARRGGAQAGGGVRKNLPLLLAGGGALVVVVAVILASFGSVSAPAGGGERRGGETSAPPVASEEVAAILRQAEAAHREGRALFADRKYREAHPHFEQARDLYRQALAMKPSLNDGIDSRMEDLQRDLINCERNVHVGGGGAE